MQHCQQSLLRTLRNTPVPISNDWVQKSGYERKTLVRTVCLKGEHKNDLIRTKVCPEWTFSHSLGETEAWNTKCAK